MGKDIGPLIKMLNDKLKASADASLKKNRLTFSQTIVMEFIHSQGGQTTQKEVEEYMGVAHPTVVGIISRLEKNGFLSCSMDESNRRNKVVRETDKALKMSKFMLNERTKKERQLTKGLSDEELNELRRMLLKIYQNIE